MRSSFSAVVFTLLTSALLGSAQQIYDIYTTTWDRKSQFKYTNLGDSPVNFVNANPRSANIVISESDIFQNIDGFGGSLTDNAAQALVNLKSKNEGGYFDLLNKMFNATDTGPNAGLSFLRIPLAASDFSPRVYSFNDANSPDNTFSNFSLAPASTTIKIVKDIQWFNPAIKLHMVAWSPPAWMKTTGSMRGGLIKEEFQTTYAKYLLKVLQAYNEEGIVPYSISIQNEPENNNPTYPTCIMTPEVEGAIGTALRSLMDSSSFDKVKLVGFEHNWSSAGKYPVQLMKSYGNAFTGAAFHCYEGSVRQQDDFADAFLDKEIYVTECTGTVGSDYWQDIKWYMDNLFIGAVEHGARTAMMWNLVADSAGNPKLPGTDSCGNGCRGIVTVNGDGTWSFNQEYYAMAQASIATIPRDQGGPSASRIGVTVEGSNSAALRVMAYRTERVSSTDQPRFSLVVMNWNDSSGSSFRPRDVTATIEFRGQRATYAFPVGVTTLSWYARTSPDQTRRILSTTGGKCGLIKSRSHRIKLRRRH